MSRVGEEETAFSQRDVAHNVSITAVWTADDTEPERHIAWARRFQNALEPFVRDRVYLNFLGDEGTNRIRAAYGDANYERLVALKEVWDPSNSLRGNHNIQPRTGERSRRRVSQ